MPRVHQRVVSDRSRGPRVRRGVIASAALAACVGLAASASAAPLTWTGGA